MSALSLSLYNSHPVECSRGEGEGEHMTMTMMIGNLARLCREREREREPCLYVFWLVTSSDKQKPPKDPLESMPCIQSLTRLK